MLPDKIAFNRNLFRETVDDAASVGEGMNLVRVQREKIIHMKSKYDGFKFRFLNHGVETL